MKTVRQLLGIVALACVIVALNLFAALVNTSSALGLPATFLLAVGVVCGVAWLILSAFGISSGESRGGRPLFHGVNTLLGSLLFLCICIVAYAFVKHSDRRWDLTREGRQAFSPQTIRLLQGLDRDVSVICLFSGTGDQSSALARDKTQRFFERCAAHTTRLNVEFIDPQKELVRVKAMGIPRVALTGTVVVKSGTKQRVITLDASGVYPKLEERDFTNALLNVVRNAQPKICFLTGHGERDILNEDKVEGGSLFKNLLEAEAYKTERVAIPMASPKLPADCDVLVINGMGTKGRGSDLQPGELDAIQQYMDHGGKMFILLDPNRVASAPAARETLRPWLEQRYGIRVGQDLVISKNDTRVGEVTLLPDASALALLENEKDNLPSDFTFEGCFSPTHPVTRGFNDRMVLLMARSVTLAPQLPEGAAGEVILRALPTSWAETNLDQLMQGQAPRQDPGELSGAIGVAAAVTANIAAPGADTGQPRDARIIVVGDSDFAANEQARVGSNINFLMNAMAWLTESNDLIAIRPSTEKNPPVILTVRERQAIGWISTLGVLQTVLVIAALVYWRRRKRQ